MGGLNQAQALEQAGSVELATTPAPRCATTAPCQGKRQSDNPLQRHISHCLSCHWEGALGAPRFGQFREWEPRIAQGMETLYAHAINGFNSMPAMGACKTCSEADIKALVDYMVKKASK